MPPKSELLLLGNSRMAQLTFSDVGIQSGVVM